MIWESMKKGFDAWENATAGMLEVWLKSPAVLKPGGALLSALFKAKVASDKATAAWWGLLGLSTRGEQERILHELHRVESRLHDLEEKLDREAKP